MTAGAAALAAAGLLIVAFYLVRLRLRLRMRQRQPVAAAEPAARMLGRYRLEEQIGEGAMGPVYAARDPQRGIRVAIKTLELAREFEGEQLAEARSRLAREAQTAGLLRHPDIVTVLEAGEAGALAYLVMELAPGHDLRRHTAAPHLLPVASVLEIAARVAEALAHAHARGVVHRDIKPANLIVDLEGGSVKVADFGIARVADMTRTRTGLMLGTPCYMSPEQLAGARLDGRSDLYALGVVLFQMLAGELPHREQSMAALMRQIATEPAPDVRQLRPELPEELANIVALALEKRAEVRYADGREMAADLRAVARWMAEAQPRQPGAGALAP